MRSVDTKTASLLAHVSLMIAACTFLDDGGRGFAANLFLSEAFAYVAIALVLLSCLGLSMYAAPSDVAEMRQFFARSCQRRTTIYLVSLWLTMLTTVAVLVTMAVKYLH